MNTAQHIAESPLASATVLNKKGRSVKWGHARCFPPAFRHTTLTLILYEAGIVVSSAFLKPWHLTDLIDTYKIQATWNISVYFVLNEIQDALLRDFVQCY
jgi:hypothetical protein